MKQISYGGEVHNFPDDFSEEDISKALIQFDKAPSLPSLGVAKGIRGPLTWLEQLKALGKQTLRAAPETAGFIGGGIAGGMAAGPPGAIGGAAIGAGAGKGLEQTLRSALPGLFGGAQSYEGKTPAQEQIESILYGGLGEATGQATRLIPKLISRTNNAETMRRIGLLRGRGVPVTAGDYRPGGTAQISENLLRGTLLGGRTIAEHDVSAAKVLNQWRTGFVNSLGPEMGRVELGEAVGKSVEKRAEQLFAPNTGLFSKLYKSVDALYPENVDASGIRTWAEQEFKKVSKLVSQGTGLPSASSKQAPSKYLNIINDLRHYGQKQTIDPVTQVRSWVDAPLTYSDVWQSKQMIDSMIRSEAGDPLRTQAKGTLKQIHTVLDDAMTTAAQKANPQAATKIRKINAAYGQAKQLMETDSLVTDIRSGAMDPEQIAGRFFKANSITPAKDLYRALPILDRNRIIGALRRQTMEKFFGGSLSEVESGVQTVSAKGLQRKMSTLEPELKSWLKPEQYQGLKDFVDAAYQAQTSGRMTNPASGRQMLAYGQMGAAATLLANGAVGFFTGEPGWGQIGTGITIVFSPAMLAKVMTNPTFSRTFAEGFKMSAETAAKTGWIPRVMNIYRIISEQKEEEPTQ